jgi:NuA3 HAT complex component NTO1
MLAELVRKREKEKLRRAQIFKDVVDEYIFPQDDAMHTALRRIAA